jgi:tetratricopeptide (TPR) repeat protein
MTALSLTGPAQAQEGTLPARRAAAAERPSDVAAQLAYGRALIEAGHLDQAEKQMDKAVRASGGDIETLFEAVRVKFAGGNYKRVRAACRELKKKDPDHVLTHVCMARAFLVWRRASRALPEVEQAIAAAPNNYEALLAQGDARRMRGDFEGAKASYQKALSVNPKGGDAYLGIGLLHLVRHQRPEALAALGKALQVAGDDPDVQFELGRAMLDDGQAEGALRLLAKAAAGRPDWEQAKLYHSIALLKSGNAKEAEAALLAYLKRHPDHPVATAQLGGALVALGKYERAEQVLQKALVLSPNDFDTAFSLARLFEKTGRSEEAFTQYRAAADLDRESPRPLIEAARLGVSLQRPMLASALVEKALERAPRSAAALAIYGDALLARGERAAAKERYQQALKGEGPVDRARIKKQLDALK